MKKYIPSTFTLLNLTCGFAAILIGDFYISSWFIVIGMIFDVIDGLLARMLNAYSDIGKELDSMADLITFGMAPAYLYYLLAPGDQWYFTLAPLIFLLGSALRLAIFNTLPSKSEFIGLATPAAAFFLLGVFLSYNAQVDIINQVISNNIGYFAVPVFLTMMMLSHSEMYSLKGLQKPLWKNPYHGFSFTIFVIFLFLRPELSPIIAVFTYIFTSKVKAKRG